MRSSSPSSSLSPFGRPAIFCLVALVILCAMPTVAGCGANQPVTGEEFEGVPERNRNVPPEPVTLQVWMELDFITPDPLYREMVSEFERMYPNVNVEIETFVRESMTNKLRDALQTGTPPDVVQCHVLAMAAQGYAAPLDDLWREWNAEDIFLPQAMEEVRWEDIRYGVPLDIYTMAIIYNKDAFDRLGIQYPDSDYTWERFAHQAALLTSPTDNEDKTYGLGFTVEPWYVYSWLTLAGGGLIKGDETGYEITLNDPNNVAGLSFLISLARNGFGPLPTSRPRDYEDARKLFIEGQIAMFFGVPWDVHYIRQNAPDIRIGVVELPETPAGVGAASALGSTGFMSPRGAKNRMVAFEFMKWAVSERYSVPLTPALGRIPAQKWVLEDPAIADAPLYGPFIRQIDTARPYHLDAFPEEERLFANLIKSSFYGEDPAEQCEKAQAEIQKMADQE